jgi:hypothetical protein
MDDFALLSRLLRSFSFLGRHVSNDAYRVTAS